MGDCFAVRLHSILKQALLLAVAIIFVLSGCESIPSNLISQGDGVNGVSKGSGSSSVGGIAFQSDLSPALQYSSSSHPTAVSPVLSVDDPNGEFAQPSAPVSNGNLSLSVTDAPTMGASAIYIRFSDVVIRNRQTKEKVSLLNAPTEINLLDLQNGLKRLFGSVSLLPGIYDHLTFYVTSVVVAMNGGLVNVGISDVIKSHGLRVFGTFEIKAGMSVDALIDFDAARFFVWSKAGPIFRPIAKVRHLHFRPAGIHFEEASDGTMSLVGPARSVRPKAWLGFTDVRGKLTIKRADEDGSFRFDGIEKIFGKTSLAVLQKGHHEGHHDRAHRKHHGDHHGYKEWFVAAWIDLIEDFSADVKYPAIRASHLDSLFHAALQSANGDVVSFLAPFRSAAFRYIAGLYLQTKGVVLPSDFVFPSLPVPYAFALEGPEYELPGYASIQAVNGYFSGGPQGDGCADSRIVFEGSAPANDYGGLDSESAIQRMMSEKLPFTGLLAEHKAVCQGHDLATLSCATLSSAASAGTSSLPTESLTSIELALNSPRGGLIVGLLGCVGLGSQDVRALNSVPLPVFPQSQSGEPACWFGCTGGSQASYLDSQALLASGVAESIITDPSAVHDLDSLVVLANQAGVTPLNLLASYVADHSPSKVHGFIDRRAPVFSNLLPQDGAVTTESSIAVSGTLDDRSVASVTINGVAVAFALSADGSVQVPAADIALNNGDNVITLEAIDGAGNVGQAVLHVVASLTPPPPPPAPGVSDLCQAGSYIPKPAIKVGMSIDPNEGSMALISSGFQALGFPPIIYSDAQIVAGQPITDGISVLVISRKVTFGPVTPEYIAGVQSYIASGGSVLGEYDGAALMFNAFFGINVILSYLTPSLNLFTGDVSGGSVLLPISNSTMYVTDPADPIMAGMPSSFIQGPRAAFAISNYNSNWLHSSANFISSGYLGRVPAGTYPAVLSGRCGGGRLVLFTMNHLQVIGSPPANLMINNALHWLVGN